MYDDVYNYYFFNFIENRSILPNENKKKKKELGISKNV